MGGGNSSHGSIKVWRRLFARLWLILTLARNNFKEPGGTWRWQRQAGEAGFRACSQIGAQEKACCMPPHRAKIPANSSIHTTQKNSKPSRQATSAEKARLSCDSFSAPMNHAESRPFALPKKASHPPPRRETALVCPVILWRYRSSYPELLPSGRHAGWRLHEAIGEGVRYNAADADMTRRRARHERHWNTAGRCRIQGSVSSPILPAQFQGQCCCRHR